MMEGTSKRTCENKNDDEPAKKHIAKDRKDKIKTTLFPVDAYTRHKILMNQYVLNRPGFAFAKFEVKTDLDILKQNHRFLWDSDDEEDEDKSELAWGERIAKKYYDALYKEYCICDLSRYKENKIAMRWRVEKEVVLGKGQFICGNKVCDEQSDLKSWEANFAYKEQDKKKNALVKLRLCPPCSDKLNYHHKNKEVTAATNESGAESEISQKVDDFLQSLLV